MTEDKQTSNENGNKLLAWLSLIWFLIGTLYYRDSIGLMVRTSVIRIMGTVYKAMFRLQVLMPVLFFPALYKLPLSRILHQIQCPLPVCQWHPDVNSSVTKRQLFYSFPSHVRIWKKKNYFFCISMRARPILFGPHSDLLKASQGQPSANLHTSVWYLAFLLTLLLTLKKIHHVVKILG